MKWEEIYDRSRMVVDKAMGHLLAEVKDVEEDKDGIMLHTSRSDLSERRKINILYGGRMVTIKFRLPILMTVCQKKYSMKTDILRRNL